MNGYGGQPENQVPELHPTIIKFGKSGKTANLRLINQLLRLLLTSKHDNALDVLEDAVQLAWS